MTKDVVWVEDGAVPEGVCVVIVAKVEVSAGTAACLCFVSVACVAVDVALHGAVFDVYSGVALRVAVIEELGDRLIGAFSGTLCLDASALSATRRVL